jgi:GNAT superfamily N-acetyltransferase
MDTVVKHGSHDQSSHNPHKGRTSDLPEGWSQRSRDDIRADYVARFSGQYPNDPQRAADLAEDFADRTTEYNGPNGTRVRVELLGGGEPDAAAMRDTMEALDTCQSQVPVDGLTVVFSNAPFRDNADIVSDSTKAFVIRGEKQINMRPEYAQGAKLINREEGYSMPSAQTVSEVKYVVTHEYGHVTDRRSNRQIGDDYYALRDNGGMDALSTYGRFNDYEHLAEGWAEWSLTGGSTTNPASTYFAETYNWGTGVTKAAGDDDFERVIILDTFDPATPPTAVPFMAKSVIVAFEPGLRPVLKHGTHDQSSHGRRGGGSSLTLDAGVAQSIVERVRANGGLSVSMVDGSEPPTGFMVAKGGKQSAIVDADEFYDPVKGPEAMSSFLKENRELSEGAYLGLWHNQADGKVYLDVSENIMDRATAVAAGRERDQISIWDVVNRKEIDTGGTGAVGKAVAGSETAGPEVDDRRGDRRVRKNSVGEVRGRGVVVAFEPGLRPVLKHGSHDQSAHGRRGGGSRSPDEHWTADYARQQDAVARALVDGDYSGLNIGESRLAQRVGSAEASVMRRVSRIAERIGIKKKKRWAYTEAEASSLRESYYEQYGKPSWMGKAADLLKHLGGAHDQKSHGRGGGVADPAASDPAYRGRVDKIRKWQKGGGPSAVLMEKAMNEDLEPEEYAALKAGMENVYGVSVTGQNKAGAESTIQSKVTDVYAGNGYIKVHGTLTDADSGAYLGKFERTFSEDYNGGIQVEHVWFRIDDPDYRGTGFGTEFIRQQEDFYISQGMSRITVHAGLEDGGYTWARAGFDWDSDQGDYALGSVYNYIEDYVASGGSDPDNFFRDVALPALDGTSGDPYPSPNELAMHGYTPGATTWPGKEAMSGSDWYGEKLLPPPPPPDPNGPTQLTFDGL